MKGVITEKEGSRGYAVSNNLSLSHPINVFPFYSSVRFRYEILLCNHIP